MFNKVFPFFSNTKKFPEFIPIKPTFFKAQEIAEQIYREGYCIVDFMNREERELLLKLFYQHYVNKDKGDGAFFGVISEPVYDSIYQILQHAVDKWFVNYKRVVTAFVVKTPGKTGVVRVHQDGVLTDETQYSNITLWIPLQTVNDENSPMYIMPRSHYIFDPYRTSSIDIVSTQLEAAMQPYFISVPMPVGKALFFDSRIFHYSPPNLSDKNRVNIIFRLCSKEASVMAYYKEGGNKNARTELWQCPEDYWRHNENHIDNVRPKGCRHLGYKNATPELTVQEFEERRKKLGIVPKL